MTKNQTISVQGNLVSVIKQGSEDFISLTDMLRAKDGDFFISDWLRNRNTVEFLSIWETVHNPNFNSGESAIIKSKAGLNNYKLSVKEWIANTNAVGLKATAGSHTDAIKEQLIPPTITKEQSMMVYATEADLLNMALFGQTAATWRLRNPIKKGNIRDEATLEQLVVLTNLESINALLIRQGLPQNERLQMLNEVAIQQLQSLLSNPSMKKLDHASVNS